MSSPVTTQDTWLRRRWPTALGIVATASTLALLAPLPDAVHRAVTAWSVLLAAVIYLTWGTSRGELTGTGRLALQTAGVLGFGAVAVAALSLDGDLTRYLLAAGWAAHAVWDAYHHRDRVVPRWYAEACAASDLVVAVGLLTVAAH